MTTCDLASSWVASMVSMLVGHPLDTIAIRAETRGVTTKEAIQQIWAKRGIRGYFRGAFLPTVATGAINASFLNTYAYIIDTIVADREKIYDDIGMIEDRVQAFKSKGVHLQHMKHIKEDARATTVDTFLAGLCACFVQCLVACPVEMIKIVLQSRQSPSSSLHGPWEAAKWIVKDEGLRGLYSGFFLMTIRNTLYGITSCMFLNEFYTKVHTRPEEWWVVLPAAGLATTVATGVTLPFDVVKSRIQAQDHHHPQYDGWWHCTRRTFQKQGLAAFWRGFLPIVVRTIPVEASYYITNENFHAYTKICEGNIHGDLYMYLNPVSQDPEAALPNRWEL